jgi:hypothetical protein
VAGVQSTYAESTIEENAAHSEPDMRLSCVSGKNES